MKKITKQEKWRRSMSGKLNKINKTLLEITETLVDQDSRIERNHHRREEIVSLIEKIKTLQKSDNEIRNKMDRTEITQHLRQEHLMKQGAHFSTENQVVGDSDARTQKPTQGMDGHR